MVGAINSVREAAFRHARIRHEEGIPIYAVCDIIEVCLVLHIVLFEPQTGNGGQSGTYFERTHQIPRGKHFRATEVVLIHTRPVYLRIPVHLRIRHKLIIQALVNRSEECVRAIKKIARSFVIGIRDIADEKV